MWVWFLGVVMEVCIDSVESAVNAQTGGASRVELCCNLLDGGLTPSLGIFRRVKACTSLPIFVMIRPRGGDFCYTRGEFEVMKEDVEIFKREGADGMVFGILQSDGTIDEERCRELLTLSQPLPATFHRAFDVARDPHVAMETIISLGFARILTIGGEATAMEGIPLLKRLVESSSDRVTIMAGGGLTVSNVEHVLRETGVREFHGSASSWRDSNMEYRNESISMGLSPNYSTKVTDSNTVTLMVKIYHKIYN